MYEAQEDRRARLLAAGDRPQIEALWQRIHDRVIQARWSAQEIGPRNIVRTAATDPRASRCLRSTT
jgi:hypothetical protein